jgi:hypothetical protein
MDVAVHFKVVLDVLDGAAGAIEHRPTADVRPGQHVI